VERVLDADDLELAGRRSAPAVGQRALEDVERRQFERLLDPQARLDEQLEPWLARQQTRL
jgi:hypothetical protein